MQMCSSISLENLATQVTNQPRVCGYYIFKPCPSTNNERTIICLVSSGERHLDNKKNNFEKSTEDKFTIEAPNLGKVRKVTIGHNNKGSSAGWFVDKVRMESEVEETAPCFWSRNVFNYHSCATVFISGSATVLKTSEMVVGALVCTHTHTHCRHSTLCVKWNHFPLRNYLTCNGQIIYTLLQVFFTYTTFLYALSPQPFHVTDKIKPVIWPRFVACFL